MSKRLLVLLLLACCSASVIADDSLTGNFLKYGSIGAVGVAGKLTADELRAQSSGSRIDARQAEERRPSQTRTQAGPISVVVTTGSGELGPMTKGLLGFFKSLSETTSDAEAVSEFDGQPMEKSGSNSALLRRNLNKEIRSSGNSQFPEDPEDCSAHHIVPAKENRKFAAENAQKARNAIDGCVEMDSAENGIYLPNKREGSKDCQGSYHNELHNSKYYQKLSERLTAANDIGGCQSVKAELKKIKIDIFNGVF